MMHCCRISLTSSSEILLDFLRLPVAPASRYCFTEAHSSFAEPISNKDHHEKRREKNRKEQNRTEQKRTERERERERDSHMNTSPLNPAFRRLLVISVPYIRPCLYCNKIRITMGLLALRCCLINTCRVNTCKPPQHNVMLAYKQLSRAYRCQVLVQNAHNV